MTSDLHVVKCSDVSGDVPGTRQRGYVAHIRFPTIPYVYRKDCGDSGGRSLPLVLPWRRRLFPWSPSTAFILLLFTIQFICWRLTETRTGSYVTTTELEGVCVWSRCVSLDRLSTPPTLPGSRVQFPVPSHTVCEGEAIPPVIPQHCWDPVQLLG